MGGGVSRLNAHEGEVVSVKNHHLILRRRFEELRNRRNGATLPVESTLSKKQLLLKDAEEEANNFECSHETAIGTEEEKGTSKETEPLKEEKMVRAISMEKSSRVVPLSETEEEKDTNVGNIEQDNQHKDHDQEKVNLVDEKADAEVRTEEGKTAVPAPEPKLESEQEEDAKPENQQVDEKSDDDESEEYGRLICPGSPSFRIYCIEAEKRKEEEEEEERKSQTIVIHKKLPSADSVECASSRNLGSSKEALQVVQTESTQKKKGNKVKKFGAVKTLLKVKSCYHPSCTCTGDDRGRLLVAKATN